MQEFTYLVTIEAESKDAATTALAAMESWQSDHGNDARVMHYRPPGGVVLGAEFIRDELAQAYEIHGLAERERDAIWILPDEYLDAAMVAVVDDRVTSFWPEAYALRRAAIRDLAQSVRAAHEALDASAEYLRTRGDD